MNNTEEYSRSGEGDQRQKVQLGMKLETETNDSNTEKKGDGALQWFKK